MLAAAGTWDQLHWGQLVAGGCPQVSARHTGSRGWVPRCVPLSQMLEEPTDPGKVPLLWHQHPLGDTSLGATLAWG